MKFYLADSQPGRSYEREEKNLSNNYFKRIHALTPTRFWINNVTREEADLAIAAGAVGCTQNPAYVWKMMTHESEKQYVEKILERIIGQNQDANQVLIQLQSELVNEIARRFMPLYETSNGKYGYVSIQGDPFKEDTQTIIDLAHANCSAYPNIMAKIPATVDGLQAIEMLAGEGIPINATEVMAVRQALDVCDVYTRATANMHHPAPIYYSHITGIYDEYLSVTANQQGIEVSSDSLWHAGMSIAKKTYHLTKSRYPQVGFIGGGARGLHHFTEMVGADAVVTINWINMADRLISLDGPVVEQFARPVPYWAENELLEKLPDYRRGYEVNAIRPEEYEHFGPVVHFRLMFEDAWLSAKSLIEKKMECCSCQ